VGEHFGRLTSFPLAVRYEGGDVREDLLGSIRLQPGMVFHNTAIYELLYLLALFAFLTWLLYLRPKRPRTGTAIGIFCAYYGITRFLSDSLRVNDERVLGLTGAQWMCVALLPTAAWILVKVRRQLDDDVAAEEATSSHPEGAPDEVEAPNGA
jgi:prolipoprotein diacylglyceryltransferase